ncbi:MAG: amino acid ABC transporter substrate-binding protein [Alphaproteobacteria bacterium]|nr:amino acid ABC transporter substrate-binding protein [Alphaproteobacteria bacterium]
MVALFFGNQANAGTLEIVQERGLLRCGVVNSGIGLSEIDTQGHWRGFFPDFCRFIAAAILGNADAVEYVEVNYVTRFEALNTNAFDVLMANTTWTAGRDIELKLDFTHPLFYDGQGFLAHKSVGARSVRDLVGEKTYSVCVSDGTTTIDNLRDLVATHNLKFKIVAFQSVEGVYDAFFARVCDLMTQDRVALVSQRLNRAADPNSFILFPDIISKEPLGPAIRQDDQQWADIVQWCIFAAMMGEENRITSENIDTFMQSSEPEIQRLLGIIPDIGDALQLPRDWAYQGLKQVGSYSQIYDRTLGKDSSMELERGLNALWTDGGLLYVPPLR